jgi:hypothetical protein
MGGGDINWIKRKHLKSNGAYVDNITVTEATPFVISTDGTNSFDYVKEFVVPNT